MENIIGRHIGNWEVCNVDYSIVTKKINLKVCCNVCKNISDIEVDNISELGDIICYTDDKLINESKYIIDNERYKESSDNEIIKVGNNNNNNNNDRYIKNKLNIIWKRMIDNKKIGVDSQWEDSFDNFEVWSINNGYKPWKVLDRYDNSLGYTPTNCMWRLDNRSIPKEKKSIIEDNSISNAVKYLKDISYSIADLRLVLLMVDESCNELLKTNYINNMECIKEFKNNIDGCIRNVVRCSDLINEIDLKI